MKYKIIIIGVLSFLSVSKIQAQQDIHSTVEVNRQFEGKLLNVRKSDLNTTYSDTLTRFNLNFNYSIFDKPYRDLYEFNPLPSVALNSVEVKYPVFMAKLGLGFKGTPEADIYFTPNISSNFSLALNLNHKSFWGKLPLVENDNSIYKNSGSKIISDRMTNGGGFKTRYQWKNGEINTYLDYDNNVFLYTGINTDYIEDNIPDISKLGDRKYLHDNFSHKFNRLIVLTNVKSKKLVEAPYFYDCSMFFTRGKNNPGITESILNFDLNAGFLTKNKRNLVFGLKVMLDADARDNSDDDANTYSMFNFKGQYRIDREKYKVGLGLVLAAASSEHENISDVSNIMPAIDAEYNLVKNNLTIYGRIDGENNFESFYKLSGINPWLSKNLNVGFSSIPIRVALGLKGRVGSRVGYNLFMQYSDKQHQAYFIEDRASVSNIDFMDYKEMTYGASIKWTSQDISLGADFKFNSYLDDAFVFMLPKDEQDFYFRYNLKERFIAKVTLYRRSKVNGVQTNQLEDSGVEAQKFPCTMRGFANLGLELKYILNPTYTFYIKGDNLLNQDIQYVLNYAELPLNIGAGIYVKF